MKKIFVVMLLCVAYVGLSAKTLSASFGYGAHHGGLGAKVLILTEKGGDSGIFMGGGTFDGETMFEFGIQGESNGYYGDISYGGIGVQTEWNSWDDEEETNVINGWTLLGGYVIDLDRTRTMFIDLGSGYSFGKSIFFEGTSYEYEFNWKSFTFDVGLGIRF